VGHRITLISFKRPHFIREIRSNGLGLLCLTPLSTIFQLFRGGNVYNGFMVPNAT